MRAVTGARACATTHLSIGNVTTPIARPLPGRLLGVWAHPDDECYLSAGLMARVVAAGGAVRLVCATRGELGTDDPELAGTVRFARTRQAELESSLAVLGVHDVHIIGLADGGCDDAADCDLSAVVTEHLTSFRPDTVVTFGPDGITGHPDHRAVSRWTTAAASAAPDIELLYAAMTHDHVDRHRTMHESLGLFGMLPDGRPHAVPRSAVALRCSLDHGELIRKRLALREHRSQTSPLAALVGEDTYFSWWKDECFRRPTPGERAGAAPNPTGVHRPIGVGS